MDRLVCAIMGGVLGFIMWLFAYAMIILLAMKAAGKAAVRQPAGAVVDPFAILPAFSWGGLVMAGFAIFGAVVGAERMMDVFESVIHVEGEVARHVNRS